MESITKLTQDQKKQLVLTFLEVAPIYKYAANSVGIDEDTLKHWRDNDKEFADACKSKISEFVRRTVKRTRPEFQLERMLRNDFSERKELTGKDGEALLPTPIYGGQSTDPKKV